jgi:GntR family transcriptional repressor for pyruvate dehydrogenase complex
MPHRWIRALEVMEELRSMMQAGRLMEGDRLPAERDLAREFGVTRPTLRAALEKLKNEKYLTVKRGKRGGWFVTDLSRPKRAWMKIMSRNIEEFEDALDFRIAVEVMASRLAALRRGPEELAMIDNALRAHEVSFEKAVKEAARRHITLKDMYVPKEAPSSELRQAGLEFHEAIARASRSRRLQEAGRKARAELFQGGKREMLHDGLLTPTMEDHRAIADAIRRGDAVVASEAMRAHLERAREMLRKTFLAVQ